MPYSASEPLSSIREALHEIGYQADLVVDDYPFADYFSPSFDIRHVPLAAFGQYPPSYRSSGIGVLVSNGYKPVVKNFLALGAPHWFVIHQDRNEVDWWKTHTIEPEFVEAISIENIAGMIRENQEVLGPSGILRAKSLLPALPHVQQLDFYDIGLLPVLEHEAHSKLDTLFNRTFNETLHFHRDLYDRDFSDEEYRSLYRLTFRLIAAKLLADRQFPGDWVHSDVHTTLDQVEKFYFRSTKPESITLSPDVQQLVWDSIRGSFRLQNLSLEALAYVYENTFVTKETRRLLGTHATPPNLAEFVVRQLPFEDIVEPSERTVFEPFAGHAPFLTASLGRLRDILPASMNTTRRHEYFTSMLSGIEVDSFAREVARYSLILADYPNPNGWQIEEADAFQTPRFFELLRQANIVLCNPPYGKFTKEEIALYGDSRKSPHKAVEALLRILESPPLMLGMILPATFLSRRGYKEVRKRLVDLYGTISLTVLPDTTFSHSEVETAVLVAWDRDHQTRSSWRNVYVSEHDNKQFWQTGQPTWAYERNDVQPDTEVTKLWENPLFARLRDHFQDYPKLGEFNEIKNGIEYKGKVSDHISNTPLPGFVAGVQHVNRSLHPYLINDPIYVDTNQRNMRTKAFRLSWEKPKVVVNAARISRSPWRLVAGVDNDGLIFSHRFHAIWPETGQYSVNFLSAVLNGIVANAMISSSAQSRDNYIYALSSIPLPLLKEDEVESIEALVKEYIEVSKESDDPDNSKLSTLALRIDLKILDRYQLPESLLSELFDFMGSIDRYPFCASFKKQLYERYAQLVDKKYEVGISSEEVDELNSISFYLDAAEASYYSRAKKQLEVAHEEMVAQLGLG